MKAAQIAFLFQYDSLSKVVSPRHAQFKEGCSIISGDSGSSQGRIQEFISTPWGINKPNSENIKHYVVVVIKQSEPFQKS